MLKNNSICYIRFLNFLKYFIYHIKILNLKQIFRIEYLHEYFSREFYTHFPMSWFPRQHRLLHVILSVHLNT